jgi:hypothetical protein
MLASASALGLVLGLAGGAAAATPPPSTAPPPAKTWHVAATYPPISTTVDFVACGSATHCQAVTSTISGSALLGTADGTTWAAEPLPAGIAGLGPVSCGSATTCQAIAVTSAGALAMIGTATAGRTWVTEALPAGLTLTSVSCGSAVRCQLSGARNGVGLLLGTANGGKTWTAETLPSGADEAYAVSCATATDCQAVGVTGTAQAGEIYGTTNGGVTWAAEKNLGTTSLYVVSCPTAASCQALGATSSGHFVAYRTATSGKTWTAESLPAGAQPTTVSCTSASHCLAAGQDPSGEPAVIATANGGTTWTAATTPRAVTAIDAIACAAGSRCEAVGESSAGIGALAATASQGSTWSGQHLPLELYALSHIACGSPARCQAVGREAYGGAIVTTATGGVSWAATAQTSGALGGVACGTASRCVAVGGSLSLFTQNGSAPWTTAPIPATVRALNAVACPAAMHCLAAGQSAAGGAVITSTSTGGRTWSTAPVAGWSLAGLACGSATRCVAAGETGSGGGEVLVTGNGGHTWQPAPVPAGVASLGAVACGSATDCYIAGRSGGTAVILGTTSGGSAWQVVKLPAGVTSVTGLACAPAAGCQLAGGTSTGQDVILGTVNGGRNWTSEPLPGGITGLTAIACTGSACLAAGTDDREEAVLLRYAPARTASSGTVAYGTTSAGTASPGTGPASWRSAGWTTLPAPWGRPGPAPFRGTARAAARPASGTGPQPAGFKAVATTWLTAEQGWVLGTAPCGIKTCTEVISTSDGGATWTQDGSILAPTPPAGNATTGVTQIRFDTPAIGWAFGPDLYRTTNGGRTWTKEPIPGTGSKQVLALATTATAAYAVTSPCAYQAGTCAGNLPVWRTGTLTRESWARTPLALPMTFAADLSAYGSTVYADDNTEAVSYLYASTNGGVSFASRPVPCQASQDLQLVQAVAASATRVDLLCDGNPGFSQAVKTVYRSANTGQTDTSAGTMGLIGIQAQLAVSPSGNLAVASSSDGSFIYLNTGGMTWSMPVGLGDGGLGWSDLTYVTDSEAWVVYSPGNEFEPAGKVLVTRDGGRHWNIAGL